MKTYREENQMCLTSLPSLFYYSGGVLQMYCDVWKGWKFPLRSYDNSAVIILSKETLNGNMNVIREDLARGLSKQKLPDFLFMRLKRFVNYE